eukprot:GHVS01071981.1.p1 GENE.GHVS01071981.1~~GHVS01071981.1.p1  ORF type:complete len:208 (+),score=40.55 GHVS01071981.1:1-624(+)
MYMFTTCACTCLLHVHVHVYYMCMYMFTTCACTCLLHVHGFLYVALNAMAVRMKTWDLRHLGTFVALLLVLIVLACVTAVDVVAKPRGGLLIIGNSQDDLWTEHESSSSGGGGGVMKIPAKTVQIGILYVGVVFMVLFCGGTLFFCVFGSAVIVLCHACFFKKDAFLEQSGREEGEEEQGFGKGMLGSWLRERGLLRGLVEEEDEMV